MSMLVQKILDDLVSNNLALASFLSQAQNQSKYIAVELTDIKKRFIFYTLPEKLLSVDNDEFAKKQQEVKKDNPNADIPHAEVIGSLKSFMQLSKHEHINPAVLHELQVQMHGELGLVQRFAEAMKQSSLGSILQANMSKVIDDLPAEQLSLVFSALGNNAIKAASAFGAQKEFIKSQVRKTNKDDTKAAYILKERVTAFEKEIQSQEHHIEQLEQKIGRIKELIKKGL